MSIYATWLSIEHPDDWIANLREDGIEAGVIGDDSEERELGSPWLYQGSHVLPSKNDPRGGFVEVAAIPSFIERDGQDGGGEGELKDWLRLWVEGGKTDDYFGEVVILNRAQVEALHETLGQWLEREPDEG